MPSINIVVIGVSVLPGIRSSLDDVWLPLPDVEEDVRDSKYVVSLLGSGSKSVLESFSSSVFEALSLMVITDGESILLTSLESFSLSDFESTVHSQILLGIPDILLELSYCLENALVLTGNSKEIVFDSACKSV